MTEHVASRTLVKSPPELWAECSDATSLARHLDQFGEIRITRLEPETAVAWEGECARGTVRIEPSGWGTKVILTAVAVEDEASEPAVPAEPEEPAQPVEVAEPVEEAQVAVVPEPLKEPEPRSREDSAPEPEPEPEPAAAAVADPVRADQTPTDPPARRRRFARLFELFKAPPRESVLLLEPVAVEEPAPEPEPALEPERELEPAPELELEPEPEPEPDLTPEPEASPEPLPVAGETPATEAPATEAALSAALDSLGQAHHRPYSRA